MTCALRPVVALIAFAFGAIASASADDRVLGPTHCPQAVVATTSRSAVNLEPALAAARVAPGDPAREAQLLEEIAEIHRAAERYAKAEAALTEALAIRRRRTQETEAYTHGLYLLGRAQWRRGRLAAARDTLQACVREAQTAPGARSPQAGDCLHWLGVAELNMGQYADAEATLRSAVDVRTAALGAAHPDTAYAEFTLGAVYMALGDHARAETTFQHTLELREAAFGACGLPVADSLNNLGYLKLGLGRAAEARPTLERALDIRRAGLGDRHALVAQSMNNLGRALVQLGRHAEGVALLRQSLETRDRVLGPEHRRTVHSVLNLVEAARLTGWRDAEDDLLARGLRGALASEDPELVWRFYDALRAYHQRAGRSYAAAYFGKQAVNTLQSIRVQLTGLSRSLQRSFLSEKEAVYRRLADLLIDMGRLPEAQDVLSMLKEEEYFDFIRRDSRADVRATQAGLSKAERSWQERLGEVSGRIAALGAEREALRRKARSGLTDAERVRRKAIRNDLAVARKAFSFTLAEIERELRPTPTRLAEIASRNLDKLRALQGTLAELGEGVVLLNYVVGAERLRILLTTAGAQLAREVQISEKEVNRRVHAFREVLQEPARTRDRWRDPRLKAQDLYRLLIAPVAKDLRQAGARLIMLGLDGALRYVPIGALHDGERYVIERYALALFTEAAKDKLKDVPGERWRVAGLGLTRQVPGFDALPGVRDELEGIVRAKDGRGVLPGEIRLDDAFTANSLRDSLDQEYPVLHIASHFVFAPGTESDSFLVLGDGVHLSLRALREGDFDFRAVDLITLSACETAVGGGQDANGREIEGFAALAQRQGARSVLATLWPVADASTGHFMREVYRQREARKLSKAQAVRAAQRALLSGSIGRSKDARPDSRQGYAHPFFWAPFILMGNWR